MAACGPEPPTFHSHPTTFRASWWSPTGLLPLSPDAPPQCLLFRTPWPRRHSNLHLRRLPGPSLLSLCPDLQMTASSWGAQLHSQMHLSPPSQLPVKTMMRLRTEMPMLMPTASPIQTMHRKTSPCLHRLRSIFR